MPRRVRADARRLLWSRPGPWAPVPPREEGGVDATLRSLAQTPMGPRLLIGVEIGLVLFVPTPRPVGAACETVTQAGAARFQHFFAGYSSDVSRRYGGNPAGTASSASRTSRNHAAEIPAPEHLTASWAHR